MKTQKTRKLFRCCPWRRWSCLVLVLGLWPGVWCTVLTSSVGAASPRSLGRQAPRTARDMPQALEHLARHDPRAVFALAQVWQAQGNELPEHILKTAVATAVQQPVSWQQAEAAIRGFDLYKERAWAREVFAPFIATYATHILANAAWFSRWHQAWTTGTIADLASHMPALVLSELQRLVEVDARWARHLAETITSTTPTLAFAHAKTLLAVDRQLAQGILQSAITRHPRKAIAAV